MTQLTPIKVKIGLGVKDGQTRQIYPQFNDLQAVKKSGMDWSHYIDVHGAGWHYDKVSPHDTETPDSPRGIQYGMILVPQEFADEAITKFPETCQKLNEVQAQKFWDERAHAHERDTIEDNEVLQTIAHKKTLGLQLTQEDLDALNPDHPSPGIKKNWRKKWQDYKQKTGLTIV